MAARTLSRRRALAGVGAVGLAAGGLGRSPRAATPALTTVEPGFLTVAINGDMPMTTIENGELAGTDGAMIAAIARKLGLEAKPALMEWSATIESVKTGRADVMLGNMGWTPTRARVLCITDAIYYTGSFAAMKADRPTGAAVTIGDFAGHSIGTVTGFSTVPELKQVPDTTEVKLYDTSDACMRDIAAGRLDFAVLDAPTVDYMVLKAPALAVKQVPISPDPDFPQVTSKQHTVMGMSPDNLVLFDAVNAGVAWLWRTRQNAELLARYGVASPDYLVPPPTNPRVGVDRDEAGAVAGPWAHEATDFAAVFV